MSIPTNTQQRHTCVKRTKEVITELSEEYTEDVVKYGALLIPRRHKRKYSYNHMRNRDGSQDF